MCSLNSPVAGEYSLIPACDCDILPDDCFEGTPLPGVCLAQQASDGGGSGDGADSTGGGGGGGGGGPRLLSAITALQGDWDDLEDDGFTCSQLQVGGSFAAGDKLISSGVGPVEVNNGTSYTSGLHLTCPTPAETITADVFDFTLEELCESMPLCWFAGVLDLSLSVVDDTVEIATGTFDRDSSGNFTTTQTGAALSVGDHDLSLCVEEDLTGFEACGSQWVRASAPVGSGVDASGNFAGEMALDFIDVSALPGAQQHALADNGYVRVSLPSDFRFPFYGTTVENYIWIGANGGINISPSNVGSTNLPLPATHPLAPDIALYWDDLDPSSGGGVYTWYDGQRFIVSWEDVAHGRDSSPSTTDGVSVQVHIYASGYMEMHYLDTKVSDSAYDDGVSATVGINAPGGTEAVQMSYNNSALFSNGPVAFGVADASNGCLADRLVMPPEAGCDAPDYFLTICSSGSETVTLPLPDISQCATRASALDGEVVQSGTTEAKLEDLATPIPVSATGDVTLSKGVHRVNWLPVDGAGEQARPPFSQLVFVGTWVHEACGRSGRSSFLLTEDSDEFALSPGDPAPVAVIGLGGTDTIGGGASSDFIGDGVDAGVCEGHGGDDILVGEAGGDTLDGGPGDDQIFGGTGLDVLVGGDGDDLMLGEDDDDLLYGDSGEDVLYGGRGSDVLEGGDGDDVLVPGSGVDVVFGGAGDDRIEILDACELTSGQYFSGGPGNDTLYLPPGTSPSDLAGLGVTADVESFGVSSGDPTMVACPATGS